METIEKFKTETKEDETSNYNELSNNFSKCKLIHAQILKLVYKENKPISFKEIYDKLKVLGSERTLRSKIYDLEKWGLIEAIHTKVLIVVPTSEKEKEIISLVTGFYNKMGDTF